MDLIQKYLLVHDYASSLRVVATLLGRSKGNHMVMLSEGISAFFQLLAIYQQFREMQKLQQCCCNYRYASVIITSNSQIVNMPFVEEHHE